MQSAYNCWLFPVIAMLTTWMKICMKSCMSFYLTTHFPTLINQWLPSCMVYRAVSHCCVVRQCRAVCWQPATMSDVVVVSGSSATAAVSQQSWRQWQAASQHNAKYAAAQWLQLRRLCGRAYATELALNNAPGLQASFYMQQMREHLARCLESGKLLQYLHTLFHKPIS